MGEVYIVAAKRSAIGKYGGVWTGMEIQDLAVEVMRKVWAEAGKPAVDEVIMGLALGAGMGQNPARQVAYKVGLGTKVVAYTVNQVCGSGMASVILGERSIVSGEAKRVIVGGMESMSRVPFYDDGVRWGEERDLRDGLKVDGLDCRLIGAGMGMTGEYIAAKYRISRSDQDEWALVSQRRAVKATKMGWFEAEIVPAKAGGKVVTMDEGLRPETSVSKLSKLKPVFTADGTVTAGNASQISDGAAGLMLVSGRSWRGRSSMVAIVKTAMTGVEPWEQGMGAYSAAMIVLKAAGMEVRDVDLWEVNEAFAAQTVAVVRRLGINQSRVNVNGGAIALGHPLGASGARIVVTLVHNLKRLQKRWGLATICIGGGQGAAIIVENKGR